MSDADHRDHVGVWRDLVGSDPGYQTPVYDRSGIVIRTIVIILDVLDRHASSKGY